ncbi:S-layer homology domain-containing protein [Kamptonema sp. UHCC 0994]|uniref:S-layer homology domain-containing protein n=1 Tax=Kamptonema sp. UHCC 0994 TaxID=3031329 RepID=UPI0023B8DE1B|nr:S-layer homology domain-containing protein [Kamptonema sp. UHCC 0994]MDF0551889.1 S-layer homology domain-containing protein [Kamptonema sp. UHCC 0994]
MIKSHKSPTVTALALGMILANGLLLNSRIAPAFAQARFKDVQNHWAQACIEDLAEKKIISGYYEDGTFRPNRPVSRAEFAAIVRRAFPNAKPVRDAMIFVDLPTDYWAYKSIMEAYQTGFISSYNGSIFNPTLNIPRWQVVVSLSSGLRYSPTQPVADILKATFDDAADIPDLAKNAIAAAAEKQLVVNYPNVRQLKPNQDVSRAEVAAFLCQAVSKSGQSALVPSQYIAQVPADIQPTKTEISEFGKVRAEFSYQQQGEDGKNLRIKISREGQILLDEPVLVPTRSLAGNIDQKATEEISKGLLLSLRVRDLDGDGEPEVLIDLVSAKSSGDSIRNNYSYIYRYETIPKKYTLTQHSWGNVNYELEDLDRDNILEFKSQDGRFREVFANYTDSRLPLQIWQYRQGKMLDVTKQYPVQVYTNASELWVESSTRQSNNQDIKGVLAAYLASKYVLGQEAEGWQLVEKIYQGSDRAQFFGQLRQFLASNGYASGQNTADNKPQDRPDTKLQAQPETKPQDKPDTKPQDKPDTKPQDKPDTKPQDKPDTKDNETDIAPKLVRILPGSKNPIFSVAISPDGKTLAASGKQEIKLWNLETGEILNTLSGHEGNVWSVAISPDGQTLMSGSGDGSAILWDISTGEIRRNLSHTGGWINAVGFSSDNKTAISCSHNKGINLWDVTTGKLLYSLDGFNPMAIASQGRVFASSGGPSEIKLWDVVTGALRSTLAVPAVAGGGIKAIAISRDGWTLAHAMSGNSRIQVWDLRKRQALYTLDGHSAGIEAIAISPDGQTLASSSSDRTLKLWNLRTGKLMHSMEGMGAIAFSRDGQILVSVGKDNSIQIWQMSDKVGQR